MLSLCSWENSISKVNYSELEFSFTFLTSPDLWWDDVLDYASVASFSVTSTRPALDTARDVGRVSLNNAGRKEITKTPGDTRVQAYTVGLFGNIVPAEKGSRVPSNCLHSGSVGRPPSNTYLIENSTFSGLRNKGCILMAAGGTASRCRPTLAITQTREWAPECSVFHNETDYVRSSDLVQNMLTQVCSCIHCPLVSRMLLL